MSAELKKTTNTCLALICLLPGLLPGVNAEELAGNVTRSASSSVAVQPRYSPYVDRNYPDNLYWGDTHVHTNLSSDAYGSGNKLTPETAYRFARGEQVTGNSGQPVRLGRPLDFLVVTDHAEYLGVSALLDSGSNALANSEIGQRWIKLRDEGKHRQIILDGHQGTMGALSVSHDSQVTQSVWKQVVEAADRYNEPGRFTAFIGYEWTSLPAGNNLHRNIIFRDGQDKAGQVLPFSALDSRDPEDLWRYLGNYQTKTGGRVLAIPHNANVSNGLMFGLKNQSGEPLSAAYAKTRAYWEPVVEVTQIKGDGESHPYLSPEDEFADFENWDMGNFQMPTDPKQNAMLQFEYARAALKNGLALEQSLGTNPFKFGMIGSSDSHIAMSAVEENNFFGKLGFNEPSRDRVEGGEMPAHALAAAGYAAVWAQENTREAIFDAMTRREVYATTGSRISVRFFGGWDFEANDVLRADYAAIGYRKGVPMGGDLASAPGDKSPTFLLVASKDAMGANLDRIQVVKGWLDSKGQLQEKVYDVAWSGERKPDAKTGRLPAVGSTVDIGSATYTNAIGGAVLSTVWRDPEFNKHERAFYYARVLEIPTPRWSTYDAAFYNMPLTDKAPAEIQERAYTSPIWYTP